MKLKLLIPCLFFMMAASVASAQYVKVRINFPVGISINAPGRPPHASAVWIGPEWQWRSGHYVIVDGYWATPRRHGMIWVPGHWKRTGKGYKWVPGRWK